MASEELTNIVWEAKRDYERQGHIPAYVALGQVEVCDLERIWSEVTGTDAPLNGVETLFGLYVIAVADLSCVRVFSALPDGHDVDFIANRR